MDELKKTIMRKQDLKQPFEPPKDADGKPMAPPQGKEFFNGKRPEPPKDANGRPMAPPNGKMPPFSGEKPPFGVPGKPGAMQQDENTVSESTSVSVNTVEA